jgi:L-seryl-tRNA(Ser) seleniumtransferase
VGCHNSNNNVRRFSSSELDSAPVFAIDHEAQSMTTGFRSIPPVNELLADKRVEQLVEVHSRDAVVDLIREQLDDVRAAISNGDAAPGIDDIIAQIARKCEERWRPWPSRVINATGVILHTNLGRAPLSDDAVRAMERAAISYGDLEYDLSTGKRGSRHEHVSRLVCEATGAEAAMVVNNNAAAVMLGLAALAAGREVIVSRGEAVEIGGGFRIPDVLKQSGAELVEVGTTNRTYARDYETAITERTGAILAVHASNFKVMGFTHAPTIAELVDVGRRKDVPVLHDLGSGCLLPTEPYGLAPEPMPQDAVRAGVDLGFFSGDKLLGGPQAGIIIGSLESVAVVARHPLARAMRIDKINMAALAATLLHYIRGEAETAVPIWKMISATDDAIKQMASDWAESAGGEATVMESRSAIGGGSLPGETLPTWVVSLPTHRAPHGAEGVARALRESTPPVIARIEDDKVLVDPRTVLPDDEPALLEAMKRAVEIGGGE